MIRRNCFDKAGPLEKIDSLEKSLDACLYKLYEEDGIELSGGGAETCHSPRPVQEVVVLDEPRAALDPHTEYKIYTRFFEMVKNKTSMFITHRLFSTASATGSLC
ncbi:MAG: hypothetical protein LBP20_09650 [Treponema sp.]|nr:hypothetical protein [Treponema sp.]